MEGAAVFLLYPRAKTQYVVKVRETVSRSVGAGPSTAVVVDGELLDDFALIHGLAEGDGRFGPRPERLDIPKFILVVAMIKIFVKNEVSMYWNVRSPRGRVRSKKKVAGCADFTRKC